MSQPNDEVIRVPQVFERKNTGLDNEWFTPAFGQGTPDPALYFQKRVEGLEGQVQFMETQLDDTKRRLKEIGQMLANMP